MKIKDGVVLAGLDPRMRLVLVVADNLWRLLGHDLVVTAGTDGTHSAGSLHYFGLAVDLRTRYFSDNGGLAASPLRQILRAVDKRFDVVVETNHIHVELDALESAHNH
ncbi:MAG: hypothetical protein M3H12_04465 [Chromatiales bacterium]|nr:hypothetical protein [Gammaproteobacteria bacterium]